MDWNILYKLCGSAKSRIRDLFSLVGYYDGCLAVIRSVKSIIRVKRPGPNIRSHSVLL